MSRGVVAHVTFEWLLAGVDSCMCNQVMFMSCGEITDVTLEWLLTTVDSSMPNYIRPIFCSVVTQITIIHLPSGHLSKKIDLNKFFESKISIATR